MDEAKKHCHARVGGDQPRPVQQPPVEPQHLPAGEARAPELWSQDEAMLRTGGFSAMDSEPWVSSELGGSDVKRRLHSYLANKNNMGNLKAACNKSQNHTMKLVPGCMLFWCAKCRKCKVRGPRPSVHDQFGSLRLN